MAGKTRERMLFGAIDLLRERGYTAMGFRDVVAHSRAPRGSIYHHFPGGKLQLTEEALDLSGLFIEEVIRDELQKHGPVVGLRRLFDFWGGFLEERDFQMGCPIGAVAVEAHDDAPALRAVVDKQFVRWERVIASALRDEGIKRERARRLASNTVALLEGATLMCKSRKSRAPMRDAARDLEELIRAALEAASADRSPAVSD